MKTSPINLRHLRAQQRERVRRIGGDLRAMREDAGLSQSMVATAARIDRSHLSRIEAGTTDASIEVLARLGAVLGAELGIRFFPGSGPVIRDHLQVAMANELLRVTRGRWTARVEVPVYRPVRGVVDLVLAHHGSATTLETEFQSQLRRVEQQVRWQTQKADALSMQDDQAARTVSRLLVLRNTQSMREVVRTAAPMLAAAYPGRAAEAVASLTGSAPWPGATVVWMQVDGDATRLLDGPPRGVSIGR